MKILLMGCGYWGQKLERVLLAQGHEIVAKADLPFDGEKAVGPALDAGAEAAVIATPPLTHHRLGMAALRAGLDVLIEKPLAHDYLSALAMADYAYNHARVLSVDSTFVHSDCFRFLDRQGVLASYQSLRLAPGPRGAGGVSAAWDLVVHDVAVLQALGGLDPLAHGKGEASADAAAYTRVLPSGGTASVVASREWPDRQRVILWRVAGHDEPLVWRDDAVYDFHGRIIREKGAEPLANLVADFANRCRYRKIQGVTDGYHGAAVCRELQSTFGSGGKT